MSPSRDPVRDVPTTLFTGFLGVGKTTAILRAFSHRPPGGRWAVLVNEFGEIGIDGAILSEEDGSRASPRSPAGASVAAQAWRCVQTLVRLLREVRPDRLLIEPTGLAHPATVIDTLRSPGSLREAVRVGAVIGLVDPRHCRSRATSSRAIRGSDQIRLADVLVATHDDVVTDEDRAAFQAVADAAWPPKLVVARIANGEIDPAWLDLAPPDRPLRGPPSAGEHDHAEAPAVGFVWPPEVVFDQEGLEQLVQRLVRPNSRLSEGLWRLKGIFRMINERKRSGWFLVQATPDSITLSPIGHRRDSRVDLVAPPGSEVDFDGVFDEFEAQRRR